MLNNSQILGLNQDHLIKIENHLLEENTAKAFLKLQKAAKNDGFELAIAESYRSFDEQLSVWEAKANGKLTILDRNAIPVDISQLTSKEIMYQILNWSALPAASRHHWGTEIDIYDAKTININQLQQIPSEYSTEGVCGKLYLWLKQNAAKFGFFWPYENIKNGIANEPWHLSFYEIAHSLIESFPEQQCISQLKQKKISLIDIIEVEYQNILRQYIYNVNVN